LYGVLQASYSIDMASSKSDGSVISDTSSGILYNE
jgi:hypothetical protein